MDTHTSTWFWSQMLVELEMYILYPSKDQRLDGKLCLGTGGKIGKAITTSMVKASLSKLLQVMAELSLATTLCLVIGNLDRHLQGDNFRNTSFISSQKKNSELWITGTLFPENQKVNTKKKPSVCVIYCIVSFVFSGKV
jgi:hypothetical protein